MLIMRERFKPLQGGKGSPKGWEFGRDVGSSIQGMCWFD